MAELVKRAQLGNQKLNAAYNLLLNTDPVNRIDPTWQAEMDKWCAATKKLNLVVEELRADGYEQCLYIDEKGVRTRRCFITGEAYCLACPAPSDYVWDELVSSAARHNRKLPNEFGLPDTLGLHKNDPKQGSLI
jgi:hypothetical protein